MEQNKEIMEEAELCLALKGELYKVGDYVGVTDDDDTIKGTITGFDDGCINLGIYNDRIGIYIHTINFINRLPLKPSPSISFKELVFNIGDNVYIESKDKVYTGIIKDIFAYKDEIYIDITDNTPKSIKLSDIESIKMECL